MTQRFLAALERQRERERGLEPNALFSSSSAQKSCFFFKGGRDSSSSSSSSSWARLLGAVGEGNAATKTKAKLEEELEEEEKTKKKKTPDDARKTMKKKKKKKKTAAKRAFDFSTYKTRKIALEVAYCGAAHCGFSSQGGGSVERSNRRGRFVRSAEKMPVGGPIEGDFRRTVGGVQPVWKDRSRVSSLGNVVSLKVRSKVGDGEDGDEENEEIDYVDNLNEDVADDVRVLCWYAVPDGFSSRFDCTSRRYEYHFTRVHLACGENGSAHTESEDILDVERIYERRLVEVDWHARF